MTENERKAAVLADLRGRLATSEEQAKAFGAQAESFSPGDSMRDLCRSQASFYRGKAEAYRIALSVVLAGP